jgi:UPF0755 protein
MLDDLDLAWEDQQEPRRRRGPQPRQVRQGRRKERKRRRRSWFALFMTMVLLAVLGYGVYWGVGKVQSNQSFKEFVAADYKASETSTTEVTITVDPDEGGASIGQTLLSKGVIESRKAFVTAYDAGKGKSIQPGQYKLKLKMPAADALAVLVDPKNKLTNTFTIPEGMSVIKTLAKLAEATGIPLADFQAAAKDPAKLGVSAGWFSRTDGKQAAGTIEGFLFPDTYNWEPGMSATDILKMMVARFNEVTDSIKFISTVQGTLGGVSPYEALIVASMAQVEGKSDDDFGKIARVAYNRVYKGLVNCECLQFDSTTRYYWELQGLPQKETKDPTANFNDPANPYNTGTSSKGLPIGPVSNPGKAALQGAMAPPAGKWIYFVTVDDKGTTKFSDNDAQFAADRAEACRNGKVAC